MGDPAFLFFGITLPASFGSSAISKCYVSLPAQREGEFRIMRTPAKIILVVALVLSCFVSAYAQETLWKELTTKVKMLYQQGQYSEAAKVAQEALTVAQKTFGPNHPYMATSLNNLAALYQAQGRYAGAEPLCKRALSGETRMSDNLCA